MVGKQGGVKISKGMWKKVEKGRVFIEKGNPARARALATLKLDHINMGS